MSVDAQFPQTVGSSSAYATPGSILRHITRHTSSESPRLLKFLQLFFNKNTSFLFSNG